MTGSPFGQPHFPAVVATCVVCGHRRATFMVQSDAATDGHWHPDDDPCSHDVLLPDGRELRRAVRRWRQKASSGDRAQFQPVRVMARPRQER